ncbi:MAG: winged helix-turn-helix transcriptional regulator [Synechococcaceae cyanobacterium RM1_1_27]|nr:winged helix-turn-helix transcriptional regulator [Synechococcaceae cyanobacterium SM2_3_2]NJO86143.1 winged helix-turn-helix transcriptional regulator [Synechococcaceae cyanobacterium RM1_1_27]
MVVDFPLPDVALALEQASILFRALSDPIRLKILEQLRTEEVCVCDLCDRLDVPQSKLSFHLRVLREAELIQGRQEGRWIYYSLNLPQFGEIEQYVATYRRANPIKLAKPCRE